MSALSVPALAASAFLAGLYGDRVFEVLPGAFLQRNVQGALALQCRRDDAATIELLGPIDELATATCVAKSLGRP